MSTPEQFKARIRGPVFPIPTPFKSDANHAVDHDALARYVDWLVGEGAPVILVTVGTSRFNLLTTDEMRAVNETVVRTVNKRAVCIVAGPLQGSTRENIEFAQHARSIDADGIMVMYPERYYGEEAVFGFYKDVSEQGIPVLIHEMPMRSGFGGMTQFSLNLLDRLTDLPGLVGLKEEAGDAEYVYRIIRRISHKTALIGAGSMRRFMRDYHAGATSYLVGIGNFLPKVEIAFFDAMMRRDFDTAHDLVRKNEDPYFDFAVSLGWHRALKETMEIFGLMSAQERPPFERVSAAERTQLDAKVSEIGWK